jgi:CRISPR-associated protein Cmr3
MLEYVIIIQPLGLLYGSSGRFLSPENLVGRSGTQFPPTAATLSGLFAYYAHQNNKPEILPDLLLAGPFWAEENNPQNFYVPTPFNCLVKDNEIQHQMFFDGENWKVWEDNQPTIPPDDKYQKGTWVAINDWEKLQNSRPKELPKVQTNPWKFLPHLHPRLQEKQRRVATDADETQGSLFLENAVQLDPDARLIYLSNTEIAEGWYRFGGEGHLVNLRCEKLENPGKDLFNQPLKKSFALIVPAVWGSNRHSYRSPEFDPVTNDLGWPENKINSLLTQRPQPFRYRLGKRKTDDEPISEPFQTRTLTAENRRNNQPSGLLSRGRYAIPAGTVYVLEKPLEKSWYQWDESWFPQEGFYSLKRWGCGLALPLDGAVLS